MIPSRRGFLASAAALPFARAARAAEDRFAPLDKLMSGFLAEHKVPGASVAVSQSRHLVFSKGYGFADVEAKKPVDVKTLFRIASISKPVTAAAVMRLVDAGKVKLDEPVLNYVRIKPAKRMDPRWYMVTVRHCLHHTGGQDRGISGDPIGIPWQIANAFGTKPPVPLEDVIRYTLGMKLDHDPGTRFAYSNVGYLLLGRVIAEASGRHYEEYVRNEVLAPIGVTDMQLGRALPEHRQKNEATYYDAKQGTGLCLYPPRLREKVPFPDGAGNFEAYEAHGGWIASASDLVRFSLSFDIPGVSPILSREAIRTTWEKPRGLGHDDNVQSLHRGVRDQHLRILDHLHLRGEVAVLAHAVRMLGGSDEGWYGCGWFVRPVGSGLNTFHNGYISGSSTLLVRRADLWNWAVLFNSDRSANGKTLSNLIDPLMHKAVDEVIAAG